MHCRFEIVEAEIHCFETHCLAIAAVVASMTTVCILESKFRAKFIVLGKEISD